MALCPPVSRAAAMAPVAPGSDPRLDRGAQGGEGRGAGLGRRPSPQLRRPDGEAAAREAGEPGGTLEIPGARVGGRADEGADRQGVARFRRGWIAGAQPDPEAAGQRVAAVEPRGFQGDAPPLRQQIRARHGAAEHDRPARQVRHRRDPSGVPGGHRRAHRRRGRQPGQPGRERRPRRQRAGQQQRRQRRPPPPRIRLERKREVEGDPGPERHRQPGREPPGLRGQPCLDRRPEARGEAGQDAWSDEPHWDGCGEHEAQP